MADRFVVVERPRPAGYDAAVLDTETKRWAPFIDRMGALEACANLNSGRRRADYYMGWRADQARSSNEEPK